MQGPCDRPPDYVPHPGDTCNLFVCVEGTCLRSADDCICGNGRLDLGEECDWAMNAYESCCSYNCTGCLCGNGRLDPGEQCDYAVPEQLGCCNATCHGCLCGNGELDAGEECDPGISSQADCCNATCVGCAAARLNKALVASVVTVGGVLAIGLAAAVAFVARQSTGSGLLAAASTDGAYGAMNTNPLFSQSTPSKNPMYEEPTL